MANPPFCMLGFFHISIHPYTRKGVLLRNC